MRYECDQCGACCKTLFVEVYDIDVMRESKLIAADIGETTRGMLESTLMAELEQDGKCLLIAAPGIPCEFLNGLNRCNIYPTRPNVCVAMAAGDEQCQEARKIAGIAPLSPIDEQ